MAHHHFLMQESPAEFPPKAPGAGASPAYVDVAAQLNEAAIGPIGAAHYRAAFARLEAAGRAVPLWNWAAALWPPGWMAFRGLWAWLAGYLGAAAVLLAALVLAQRALALPAAVLAGVVLALWLAGAVLPGLWGDALVHRQVRRRIQQAVAAAPTMQQAMRQLRGGAPTRRRLLLVAAACMVLLAVAVGLALRPAGFGLGERAPEPRVEPAVQPIGAAAADGAGRAREALPQAAPAAPAGAPVSAQESTSSASAAAPADAVPAQEPAPASPAPETASPAPTPAPVPAPEPAEPPQATPVPGGQEKGSAGHAPAGQAGKPGRGDARPAADTAAARQLYINVGIFADPANARRVHEQLKKQRLPSRVDTLARSDGKTMRRVRVGPFTSAAQANAAAARVRALGLEAVPAVQSKDEKG